MRIKNRTMLYFETYSILQIVFLFNYVRKAEHIFFHKRAFPPLRFSQRRMKIVTGLIRFLNSKVEIATLKPDDINVRTWEMNEETVDVVDSLESGIKKTAVYKTILEIVKDENIIKCYKMQLTDHVSGRLLFLRMAKDLLDKYGSKDTILLVPAHNDGYGFQVHLFSDTVLNPYMLKGAYMANSIICFLKKIYGLLMFSFFPLGYCVRNLRKFTFGKINKKKYDIAMPVIWGFSSKRAECAEPRTKDDDSYLYGDDVRPGRIVHVFNYWRRSPKLEEEYRVRMKEQGIPYADNRLYRIPLHFLFQSIKIQATILKRIMNYLKVGHRYLLNSGFILNWMFNRIVEFENIDYKVDLIRHDYSPHHVVDTIISNKYGRKTVGIQHGANAGPYVLNNLCYVHMNKYCIFSKKHKGLYSPYWDSIELEETGYWRTDYLINITKNKDLTASIKSKISNLYGDRKHVVLISFPGSGEHNLTRQWDEMYEALCELENISLDCNIFLRFRSTSDLKSPHISRFAKLLETDKRIIIDNDRFTTYELMSVCDLYITSSHSTGMLEAVSIGKNAFTFDYMRTAQYCFGEYGKDIILNTKDDVVNVFLGLDNKFEGFDCNWELLKKDFNYHYDENSLGRLHTTISEMIRGSESEDCIKPGANGTYVNNI